MAAEPRVTIWNEYRHEKSDEQVAKIYPEGMHAVLAAALNEAGFEVRIGKRIAELIKHCRLDVKREDALTLVGYLSYIEPRRQAPPTHWSLESTYTFRLTLERARKFALAKIRSDDLAA